MRKLAIFLLFFCIVTSCSDAPAAAWYKHPFIDISYNYIGFQETKHRKELKEFMGVDPVNVPWCAAFINSVLQKAGYWGSEVVSDTPLIARSFLDWGEDVQGKILKQGDVIVFPREDGEDWQGHVGFYLKTRKRNGQKLLLIISGNDNDEVKISERPFETAIGFRRLTVLD